MSWSRWCFWGAIAAAPPALTPLADGPLSPRVMPLQSLLIHSLRDGLPGSARAFARGCAKGAFGRLTGYTSAQHSVPLRIFREFGCATGHHCGERFLYGQSLRAAGED